MRSTFRQTLNQLKTVCNKYDALSNEQKLTCLKTLGVKALPINNVLIEYHNLLLFLVTHPPDTQILNLSESELKRLTVVLEKTNWNDKAIFENTGLPFTKTVSTFSHDLLKWLSHYKDVLLKIDSFHKSSIPLTDALQFTLLSLEKEIATIGYNTPGIFRALKVNKDKQLMFLISEFDKIAEQPFIKDYLFNGLSLYVKINPVNANFSKTYNRIKTNNHYFHTEVIKQFDQEALLNSKLPAPKSIDHSAFEKINAVVKNSLTLLQRETDPVTYMDERSFRLYELERGISIAIYGMTPDRQLPLESYVGYTLFKNGLPAAYGGGWVFGKRSLFGINIFEPYRGGESGYMMCQLLRVYRQAFGVDYFEIEPYQYGLGNPEGISSGAYWFYFRFGFRSLDKKLDQLSIKEFEKIKSGKGYRSSEETLIQFTESNVALNMGKGVPLTVTEIREKVTAIISQTYDGNRVEAEKVVVKKFLNGIGGSRSFSKEQKKTLAEVAFFNVVIKGNSPAKMKWMYEMVLTKPVDLYKYQKLLIKVLK